MLIGHIIYIWTQFITTKIPTRVPTHTTTHTSTTTAAIGPTPSPVHTISLTSPPTVIDSMNPCPHIDIIGIKFRSNEAEFGAGLYVQQYTKLKCLNITHVNTEFIHIIK